MNLIRRFLNRRVPILDPTDWTVNYDWDGKTYIATGAATDKRLKITGRYRIDFGGEVVVVRITRLNYMKRGPRTWTAQDEASALARSRVTADV